MIQNKPAPEETVPRDMQAMVIDAFGAGERLRSATIPIPPTGPDEVLVRVHDAGVGIWDVMQRRGELANPNSAFPMILGAECSGDIARIGSAVRRGDLAVGTPVFTYFTGAQGAYAQYVNVRADAVVPKPAALSYAEAAAVPVDAVTAYQAVVDELAVRSGETVFVAGGAGGVGSFAVQLAASRGAIVYASAGQNDLDYVRSLGARDAIDYSLGDPAATMREIVPGGVDVAIDCVGGAGAKVTISAVRDMGRFAELTGADVGSPRGIAVSHIESEGTVERLNALRELFEQGRLRVLIRQTFPLADARSAQEAVEHPSGRGKVILAVAG